MVKYDSQEIEYQLHIDSGYYNTLDLEGFSRMMKDPSYCYKFYWLEAIVQLISEDKRETTYNDIINEMIANAWYSVLEFHVHLSGIWGDGDIKDSLEKAVLKLHKLTGLPSNVSKVEIKNKIAEFDKELHGEKITLTQNVPYKALSGFANRYSERIDLNSSAGKMMAYYNRINSIESPMLSSDYETKVKINKREFLDCIDRATLLIKEGDKKPIIINIGEETMELKIKSQIGSMNEEIEITKEGKDLMIGFNPKFLIDALRVIDDEEVELYFMNAKAPCFIKDEQQSYIYLILPVNFNAVA